MAGESPDRSKQRESSAEPTSGSAGPVPEKRDPRLAVARDASPSEARRTTDTATRVLSLPADAGSPAEGEGGSPAESEGRSPAEDGGGSPAEDDGGSPAEDHGGSPAEDGGRLREAVAAWVRSAEPSEGPGGDAGRKTEAPGRDAEDAGGDDAGESDARPAPAVPEAEEDTGPAVDDASADAGTVPDAGGAADGARTVPAARSGSDDDAEEAAAADASRDEDGPGSAASEASAGSVSAEGSDESRDSGAAATDGDADDDTPEPESADHGDGTEPEDRDVERAAAGSAAGAETPEREDGTDTGREPASDHPSGTDRDDAPPAEPDTDSGDATPAAGNPEAGSATGTQTPKREDGTDADREPATENPSENGRDAATPPGGATGARTPEDGTDADPASDHPSGTDRDATPPAEPDTDSGDAPSEADREDGKKAKGSVDQPTAVFRTRPPSVDQPTTMLKLGDAGAEAESDAEGESRDDSQDSSRDDSRDEGPAEAERTSRFVALKDFDDPAARKPPRTTDATTALRAVPSAGAGTSVPPAGPERTTQQPLPPRPPLDLLAELTNTPPPPQTPLRTAVRRVKIWTPLVLLLVIVFAVVQNVRPLPAPTLELTAEDSYTFEGGKPEIPWPADGQAALDVQGIGTFGSSGEQKPVPIASVAKVMTAYLVLRDHPLKSGAEGPMIKIDELAEKQSDAGQESTVDVTAGDEISQREAVEAVLIASANNVARLLARWDAQSEEAFVEKMNDAAKDLGMTDTTYTDPSGLNDTTVSTAVDQVKLAKEAMKQPAFREVAAMMSYDDYKGVNHSNWNQLVGHNNVVGIKTGTTTSALGNLVFAAKKEVGGETRTVVGAVVRQPAGGKDNTILSAALTSGDELIRAAQGALESATILKKGSVVGYVDDGLGNRTPVAVTEDVKAVGWAGLSVKLTFAADELPRTAKAGTKVGTLTVGDGTSSAVKFPVALREDLVEPGFTDKLARLT
ncbi:D-alanyl-D-alanine carboxypeptidase [Streptomyces sp. NPDC088106]|uniref:D-alanyl-D-alanine carboxypeptidase n=1 Tax=Streptomyces sp. NPDC088106 TaxID=3154867 RepID=UPI0034380734